jgi:phage baseplate assembly protein W
VNPANGDLTVLRNERAIQNALKNCIMIATNTVPFNPLFGSVVHNSLFDLDDVFTLQDIEAEIDRTIKYNEPRVEVIMVKAKVNQPKTTKNTYINNRNNVDPNPFDNNSVQVNVQYKIIGYLEIFNTEYVLTPTTTP